MKLRCRKWRGEKATITVRPQHVSTSESTLPVPVITTRWTETKENRVEFAEKNVVLTDETNVLLYIPQCTSTGKKHGKSDRLFPYASLPAHAASTGEVTKIEVDLVTPDLELSHSV